MKGIRIANRINRSGWMLAATFIATAAWVSGGASAQTLNTLVTFTGISGTAPGSAPEDRGGLIADAQGNLFGTAGGGGTDNDGTVFEIKFDSTTGTYSSTPTTLYSFTRGTDGANPYAGLIADTSGNLFGTTSGQYSPYGTVFEMKFNSSTGTYASSPTNLINFNGTDGGPDVYGNLVADASGNLFGTTLLGGATLYYGTVFEIKFNSSTGTYASTPTTLVAFDRANGQYPFAGLIVDAGGNLFGTTEYGGAYGYGTVYEIKFNSSTGNYDAAPTTLVNFNGADGAYSQATLIMDAHGNLFGTTSGLSLNAGGGITSIGFGTVFEIKVDSTTATGYASAPTTLVSFNGTDGAYPYAGLIADANGNLFGVTSGLFSSGYGTVFEVKTDSTTVTGYASAPTTLITFNATNGAYPIAPLIADVHGNLFGTTEGGGTTGDGTVFEVTGSGFVPPLGFAGTPGAPNCHGVSISTLAQTYGGIDHAAAMLGYPSVTALQNAVKAYCGN